MFTRTREFWQNFKAWRRGERRSGPRGARGRVYERKSDDGRRVKTKTVFRVTAKVIRADGSPDEFYNLSEGTKNG